MQKNIIDVSVFIDPLSDFGFKRIFCKQVNTALLKDLLNSILKLDKPIVEITLISTEQIGDLKNSRKAVFDVHCKDEDGNYFIIEVQKLKQEYFKDRSVYYTTFPIRSQERSGDWNFQLKKTYAVCFLEFCFDDSHPDYMVHEVKLMDMNTRETFYDRLVFVYVELPKFNKQEHELITREDKWFYVMANLLHLSEIPISLRGDPLFELFFMDARKANLMEMELQAYYNSKKAEWDEFAITQTAEKEGKAEGIAIGKVEAAEGFVISLLQNTTHSTAEIAKLTGVSVEFVTNIKEKNIL